MSESPTFFGLGIAPTLLERIQKQRLTTPTPIQHQAIPLAIQGKDVIGIAQTGTGKTLAFAIPLLQRLARSPELLGLILLPTRELALQVDATLQKLIGPQTRTAVLIGGASMYAQKEALRRRPRILVATPGRLIDHLEQRTIKLDHVDVLVLDEADRMLDMGFAPQINQILKTIPKERQTLLFSATMPQAIATIAATHMRLPVRVEVARAGTAAEQVEQEFIMVDRREKFSVLKELLEKHHGTVLVFTRTKFGAKKLTQELRQKGEVAAEIHANRSLAQRREALEGFRHGKYRILVATDIAARGIDVTGIELVVNYDLPDQSEDYVHRIGRTGRAGRGGKAVSLATPDQERDMRDIERLIRIQIPRSRRTSTLPPESRSASPMQSRGRPYGGRERRDRFPSRSGSHPTSRARTSAPQPRPQEPSFFEDAPTTFPIRRSSIPVGWKGASAGEQTGHKGPRRGARPSHGGGKRAFGGRPSGGRPTGGRPPSRGQGKKRNWQSGF